MGNNARALFCCETPYQLMNSVILRMTVMQDTPADVVLAEQTDWGDVADKLGEAHIFERVIRPTYRAYEREFYKLPRQKAKALFRNPKAFFAPAPVIDTVYTSMFVPIDHLLWKMCYYLHKQEGKSLQLFMYDEGFRSYTMDLELSEKFRYDQYAYGKSAFYKNIDGYYLHVPELYCAPRYAKEFLPIPKVMEKPLIKEKLLGVFDYGELPKERFIFMEDFFFADKQQGNDMELLESVANVVGKENIIVKRHPRASVDRFTLRGFKTMSHQRTPWEMLVLGNDMRDKVLLAVSSTAIYTPYQVFRQKVHAIELIEMFNGENQTHSDEAFPEYKKNLTEFCNQEGTILHTPKNEVELEEHARFLLEYL